MVSIACKDVAVRLGGRLTVDGVSAGFEGGELVGVIGPNGAGKSTLVRAMLGLVPTQGGVIEIDGHPVEQVPRARMAQSLAYLPQGHTLHWSLPVERLVALGRLPHLGAVSRLTEVDRAAIAEAMAKADVLHLRARSASNLSGGEKARVLLARALAVGAPGLIADEPLASLDPGHQLEIMDLMRSEADEGRLVIAVLHDLTLASRYCDRLLLLDGGRLVAQGKPADVLTPERLAQVYGIRARFADGAVVPMERLQSEPV